MEKDIKSDCFKWPVIKSWTQTPSQNSLVIRSGTSVLGSEHMNIWEYSDSLLPEEDSSPAVRHSVQYHGLRIPNWFCLEWPLKAHCSRERMKNTWVKGRRWVPTPVIKSIQLSVKSGKSLRFNTPSNFNSLFPHLFPQLIGPSCLTLCVHCVEGWTRGFAVCWTEGHMQKWGAEALSVSWVP